METLEKAVALSTPSPAPAGSGNLPEHPAWGGVGEGAQVNGPLVGPIRLAPTVLLPSLALILALPLMRRAPSQPPWT